MTEKEERTIIKQLIVFCVWFEHPFYSRKYTIVLEKRFLFFHKSIWNWQNVCTLTWNLCIKNLLFQMRLTNFVLNIKINLFFVLSASLYSALSRYITCNFVVSRDRINIIYVLKLHNSQEIKKWICEINHLLTKLFCLRRLIIS